MYKCMYTHRYMYIYIYIYIYTYIHTILSCQLLLRRPAAETPLQVNENEHNPHVNENVR